MDKSKLKQLPFSDEDFKRLERNKQQADGIAVDPEWFFIAKFGKHFGWDGVMAILRNEITMPEANLLMAAANKVDAQSGLLMYSAMYTGAGAAKARNGKQAFMKATAGLRKEAEVQE